MFAQLRAATIKLSHKPFFPTWSCFWRVSSKTFFFLAGGVSLPPHLQKEKKSVWKAVDVKAKLAALSGGKSLPNQQRTLNNKIPTELRRRNFVNKACKLVPNVQKRACNPLFQLSLHFAHHSWSLVVGFFFFLLLLQGGRRKKKLDVCVRLSWLPWRKKKTFFFRLCCTRGRGRGEEERRFLKCALCTQSPFPFLVRKCSSILDCSNNEERGGERHFFFLGGPNPLTTSILGSNIHMWKPSFQPSLPPHNKSHDGREGKKKC